MARWRSFIALLAVLAASLASGDQPAAAPADLCPAAPHRLETFALFAPALERAKQILVYLPPGYDCAGAQHYPVFYLNDGQDLFDWNPSAAGLDPALAAEIGARENWYGSWGLEARLDRAIADAALPPLIVVGIAADDGMRSRDLAPVPWDGSAEARGPQYADFMALIVVPAIDARFRTLARRRCRGIGGASLGAISALEIGLAHPERFGLVLAFSPVLRDPALAAWLADAWPLPAPGTASTFLIDFDDDPAGNADLPRFASIVAATNRPGRQTALLQSPGGRHNITSWAERVIPALSRLLPAPCSD